MSVPAGGIEQDLKMKPEEEMEPQLPPGISESGEVVDMAAYEAWQQEIIRTSSSICSVVKR